MGNLLQYVPSFRNRSNQPKHTQFCHNLCESDPENHIYNKILLLLLDIHLEDALEIHT